MGDVSDMETGERAKDGEGKPTLIYSLGFSPAQNFTSESGCSSEVSPEGETKTKTTVACLDQGEGLDRVGVVSG